MNASFPWNSSLGNARVFAVTSTSPTTCSSTAPGLFPDAIQQQYPDYWHEGAGDERSKNRYERQLLDLNLKRMGIELSSPPKYIKIYNAEEANNVRRNVVTFQTIPLVALVFNFLDMLTHGRSESDLLRELAPDESAFR